ncbi:MAG: KpsF/GutQ family sugar-phosphate isomerase [Alphaproteobacteria bacterium]
MTLDPSTNHAPARQAAVPDGDRQVAERVLHIEADGLSRLAASLDGSFRRAIDLMIGAKGRVVVTGIGKSGHIARKVSATLASTGTPSFFVHPSEASHGDLGMIALDDVVVALSNSGKTTELADIIAYARRFGLPLIGITSSAGSPLADQSDVALLLPAAPEACPMGLAPTTSTTLMLALGDAMAIALLERRGFSADDYRELHPGGALGRRLIKVSDIMHSGEELPLAGPDLSMAEAILVITAKSFGCVGIVDDAGRLTGIVTDGDLRRHMAGDLLDLTAGAVMTGSPRTIRAGALAAEALREMNTPDRPITSLFVTDAEHRPVGIIHIHDCLRAGVA